VEEEWQKQQKQPRKRLEGLAKYVVAAAAGVVEIVTTTTTTTTTRRRRRRRVVEGKQAALQP
jgi:hypothetical protein